MAWLGLYASGRVQNGASSLYVHTTTVTSHSTRILIWCRCQIGAGVPCVTSEATMSSSVCCVGVVSAVDGAVIGGPAVMREVEDVVVPVSVPVAWALSDSGKDVSGSLVRWCAVWAEVSLWHPGPGCAGLPGTGSRRASSCCLLGCGFAVCPRRTTAVAEDRQLRAAPFRGDQCRSERVG